MTVAGGFGADIEYPGNFIAASSVDQQAQNLELSGGQGLQGDTLAAESFQRQRLGVSALRICPPAWISCIAFNSSSGYEIIAFDAAMQKSSNAGFFGYLFHFHELAAQLGQKLGADWIIVSQHSKPSFLFSYLMVHLIQVQTQKLAARYDMELKGNHEKVTQHSIKALAGKIHESIDKQAAVVSMHDAMLHED